MSDVENLDVMLATYAQNELVEQQNNSDLELDLRSGKRQENTDLIGGNVRLPPNANMSENSEITAETSRTISSKNATQMSRRFDLRKSNLT